MKVAILTALLCFVQAVQPCILPREREAKQKSDAATISRRIFGKKIGHGLAIGTGDRFRNGQVGPRGLGTQPSGTRLGPIST